MNVFHSVGKFQAKKKKINKENVSFILTNKAGGYCYLASEPSSRYNGVFFNDNFRMYKVIENLRLANIPIKELKNNFFNAERKRGSIVESFFMPYGFNSFVYELNKEKEAEVILDIRESYSNPEFGRFHDIFEEKNKIIIKYRQENEFECYLAINMHSVYEKSEKWFKQEYESDRQRNSPPYEKYVFSALKIKTKKIIFSFAFDKENAIKENDFVLTNLDDLKNKQKDDIRFIVNKNRRLLKNIKGKEIKLAYICSLNSLNNLTMDINGKTGIYAGLPWFFQFWARDEAISLKSLKYFEEKKKIRNILSILIEDIKKNKKLNNHPDGNVCSADALGWILKRISYLDKTLLQSNGIKELLTELDDNLVFNDKKETWMDSIEREGARIELQALKLFMLSLKKSDKKLKENVKEKFWKGNCLKDGINDETIRPNIFIAAYIYPKLLTNKEWTAAFEHSLGKLWLDGGGLSTIDKESS